jgi:hypothetical protein
MALTSPGVEVSVINESFYVPSDAGTTPLFIVASSQDKTNGAGDSTAAGTTTANANTAYLISSQRELTETFGDPKFYTDASGNSLHGYELNEWGLQAAYSFLGVANRAYVLRANVDTAICLEVLRHRRRHQQTEHTGLTLHQAVTVYLNGLQTNQSIHNNYSNTDHINK